MQKTDALPAVKSTSIPDALKNWADLPDAAHVRDKVVAGLFGCSVPTVWRMSKDKRLPRPRKLSDRVTAWNVGELRAVLSACSEAQQ